MIDVNLDGSYRLHLDFLFEACMSDNNCNYHFQEGDTSITLTITDAKTNSLLYERETNFLDKRRSIEVFFIQIACIAFSKNRK